jgi:hypothetical protein
VLACTDSVAPRARHGLAGASGMASPAAFRRTQRAGGELPPRLATPHQLDLWRIARRPLGHPDLREMAGLLVEALTPGRPHRVVLRHLERTLTDEEANQTRDRIYAALHRGSAHQWAVRSP